MPDRRKERTQRFIALAVEPGTLDSICAAVGEGLTLAEWCRARDVRYLEVWAWLHDQDFPLRAERYERAIDSRKSLYADLVLSGLRDVSSADVRKLYDGKGALLDPHRLPDDLARVVVGVEEEEDARTGNVRRKVKLESRKTGHELLGRTLGLYRDRVEVEGKVTLEDLVNGSHQGDTHTPPRADAKSIPHPQSSLANETIGDSTRCLSSIAVSPTSPPEPASAATDPVSALNKMWDYPRQIGVPLFFRAMPVHVDCLYFTGAGAKTVTVPSGAKFALFAGTVNFWVKRDGAASVPSAASECNPTGYEVSDVSTIGIAVEEAGYVTVAFYEG